MAARSLSQERCSSVIWKEQVLPCSDTTVCAWRRRSEKKLKWIGHVNGGLCFSCNTPYARAGVMSRACVSHLLVIIKPSDSTLSWTADNCRQRLNALYKETCFRFHRNLYIPYRTRSRLHAQFRSVLLLLSWLRKCNHQLLLVPTLAPATPDNAI